MFLGKSSYSPCMPPCVGLAILVCNPNILNSDSGVILHHFIVYLPRYGYGISRSENIEGGRCLRKCLRPLCYGAIGVENNNFLNGKVLLKPVIDIYGEPPVVGIVDFGIYPNFNLGATRPTCQTVSQEEKNNAS